LFVHIINEVERVKKLNKFYSDVEYFNIISDILDNNKFKLIDNYKHHGLSRMDHSLKVSYYSYKVTKRLKLDYIAAARAGLLHDFFINEDLNNINISAFVHPYKSLENSLKYFYLSNKEKDIIISHMFPMLPHKIPKFLESWIVSLVDKIVAIYEFYYSYARMYIYRLSNFYMLMLIVLRK